MGKTFVIGDIHGNYCALLQCIERSGFNNETDTLICLGDIVDGYPESKECIEYLIGIKHLILIMANHDEWYRDWLRQGSMEYLWLSQGGQATLQSVDYKFNQSHLDLLHQAIPYYADEQNRIFVHGGFNLNYSLSEQTIDDLMWDRDMSEYAYNCEHTKSCSIPKKLKFANEIFIGHTTTERYGSTVPLKLCNVWMMDTGAGWGGKLSIMDINTHEYWQSDTGFILYGPNQGR